jgi:hypothetical protein
MMLIIWLLVFWVGLFATVGSGLGKINIPFKPTLVIWLFSLAGASLLALFVSLTSDYRKEKREKSEEEEIKESLEDFIKSNKSEEA